MHHALTLVANLAATSLTPAMITRVRDVVGGSDPVILSPGEAADFRLAAIPDMDAVHAALDGAAIDAIATSVDGRRKALLIADMDSTVVTGETLDELADRRSEGTHLRHHGARDERRAGFQGGVARAGSDAAWAAVGRFGQDLATRASH